MEIEAAIWRDLATAFERFDVIITPTIGTRGLVAGDDYVGHGLEVGGQQLEFYFQSMMTPLFNIASRCPVLNVPSGYSDNGDPDRPADRGADVRRRDRVSGRRGTRAGASVVRCGRSGDRQL